jgi:hypothetical protein
VGHAIAGQQRGVEPVGLGALSLPLDPVSDPARVHDRPSDPGAIEGFPDPQMGAPGRFQDHQGSLVVLDPVGELGPAGFGVGERPPSPAVCQGHIERGLSYSDADHDVLVHTCLLVGVSPIR